MLRKTHPWGAPPWTVDFRPAPRGLPDYVDFAIVGGGFSGLSAAAWLRKLGPGRSVLVLDSASLGDGASGRTGGMALAETAAGSLPGLGDVLAGYRRNFPHFRIDSRLKLPRVLGPCRPAPVSQLSPPGRGGFLPGGQAKTHCPSFPRSFFYVSLSFFGGPFALLEGPFFWGGSRPRLCRHPISLSTWRPLEQKHRTRFAPL